MGYKVKDGISIESFFEDDITPRTLVCRKKGGKIVYKQKGQKNAKIYADLDTTLSFKTSVYTNRDINPTEVKLTATMKIEYNDLLTFSSQLDRNKVAQDNIKQEYQKEFFEIAKKCVSGKPLEDIIGHERDLEFSLHVGMLDSLKDYGVKLIKTRVIVEYGQKLYSQNEIEKRLDILAKKINDDHENRLKIETEKHKLELAEINSKISSDSKEHKTTFEELKSEILAAQESYFSKIEEIRMENQQTLSELKARNLKVSKMIGEIGEEASRQAAESEYADLLVHSPGLFDEKDLREHVAKELGHFFCEVNAKLSKKLDGDTDESGIDS